MKCSLLKDDLSHNKDVTHYHTYPETGYGAENVGSNSPVKTGWWRVDRGECTSTVLALCNILFIINEIQLLNQYQPWKKKQKQLYT